MIVAAVGTALAMVLLGVVSVGFSRRGCWAVWTRWCRVRRPLRRTFGRWPPQLLRKSMRICCATCV